MGSIPRVRSRAHLGPRTPTRSPTYPSPVPQPPRSLARHRSLRCAPHCTIARPPWLISVVIRAIYNIAAAVRTESLLTSLLTLLPLPPQPLAGRLPLVVTVAVAVAALNIT